VIGGGGELEIFASEGDDLDFVCGSCELCDAVAEETCAIDEMACLEFACRGFEDPVAEGVTDGEDAGVGLKLATEALDLGDKRVADGLVVHNTFLGNMQAGETGGVGLDFGDFCA